MYFVPLFLRLSFLFINSWNHAKPASGPARGVARTTPSGEARAIGGSLRRCAAGLFAIGDPLS